MKSTNIFRYFKKKDGESSSNANISLPPKISTPSSISPSKNKRHNSPIPTDNVYYERDPAKCIQVSEYPVDKQDEVRRAYVETGPFQPTCEYHDLKIGSQNRRFQASRFKQYPWLEYSIENGCAFCFPCYLFDNNTAQRDTFTNQGFQNWKRVNAENCAFKRHEGHGNSLHAFAVQKMDNLKNLPQHIDRMIEQQNSKKTKNHHLCLRTSVESVMWLALQGLAFKGHDESVGSTNRGDFVEFIKLHGRANKEIDAVTLENAAKNAKYTSPTIQKEILKIIVDCVRHKIREEIGDAKFCILVHESVGLSDKEQMAIILRFVDADGFVRERFFEIVNVAETSALNLKKEICNVLNQYKLLLVHLWGPGYDGANNMRGEWNGLQALFMKDCPSAYYVHFLLTN